MFIGEYIHNIDQKGRLAIPSKFRSDLARGAVVTKSLGEKCLTLYTKEQWEKIAPKFGELPQGKSGARATARLILAAAMDLDLDGQGRVVLPEYLRQYADLKKKVIVTGVYNRLEIWDEAEWDNYKKGIEKQSGDIAEALGEIGV